ncbi:MAG: GFA family protein [Proteobacteria bacterium]|nr:GFA family protein [Pseudomonadota bacterium]
MVMLTGQCLCGALRFHFDPKGANTDYCHCKMCQRWSGAPVTAWAGVPADQFEILKGTAKAYRSSPRGIRHFCAECGSTVFMTDPEGAQIGIMLGAVDNPDGLAPTGHGWVSDQISWFKTDDHLPRWERDAPYDH